MSTKTTIKPRFYINSLDVWKTSLACYRSKFKQFAPWMVLFLILPIFLGSILSWRQSEIQVEKLYTLNSKAGLNEIIDWCFVVVGDWARGHFMYYLGMFLCVSFGYTFITRIFLDYFLCERQKIIVLFLKSGRDYLRLILPSLIVGFLMLVFCSPILPLFMACLILMAYVSVHAFIFGESGRNPLRFFFANLFLRFLDQTQVRKLDFFFMSFSTIGMGLVLFYGLESLLLGFKSYESTALIFSGLKIKSAVGISFYALIIDALEAMGLGLVLSYFAVVTTSAFFKSQVAKVLI